MTSSRHLEGSLRSVPFPAPVTHSGPPSPLPHPPPSKEQGPASSRACALHRAPPGVRHAAPSRATHAEALLLPRRDPGKFQCFLCLFGFVFSGEISNGLEDAGPFSQDLPCSRKSAFLPIPPERRWAGGQGHGSLRVWLTGFLLPAPPTDDAVPTAFPAPGVETGGPRDFTATALILVFVF